jgi:hypothetical protein
VKGERRGEGDFTVAKGTCGRWLGFRPRFLCVSLGRLPCGIDPMGGSVSRAQTWYMDACCCSTVHDAQRSPTVLLIRLSSLLKECEVKAKTRRRASNHLNPSPSSLIKFMVSTYRRIDVLTYWLEIGGKAFSYHLGYLTETCSQPWVDLTPIQMGLASSGTTQTVQRREVGSLVNSADAAENAVGSWKSLD